MIRKKKIPSIKLGSAEGVRHKPPVQKYAPMGQFGFVPLIRLATHGAIL